MNTETLWLVFNDFSTAATANHTVNIYIITRVHEQPMACECLFVALRKLYFGK